MIAEQRADRAEAILKRTFGAWKHHGVDTDTYLAELRAEWDREWVDGEWVYPGLPEEIDRKRSASAAAFGGWAHKKLDGLTYTQAIRAEWDRGVPDDDVI
ncbi:MAG: hypothetical protein C0506_03950 [Anaerolinea sp.]|nr:hypothetical protein [Anaerolinea sp.]